MDRGPLLSRVVCEGSVCKQHSESGTKTKSRVHKSHKEEQSRRGKSGLFTPVTAMAGAGWEVGRNATMLDSRGENSGVWEIPAPM